MEDDRRPVYSRFLERTISSQCVMTNYNQARINVRQMLLWSVITLFFGAVYIAVGLALYVNKMLRKLLKAIDSVQPLTAGT